MSVSDIFKSFNDSLLVSQANRSDISTKYNRISRRLNLDFWNLDVTSGGRYVGSYGRNTANSFISDIDMLFELPWSVYNTYNNYQSNGQSALLQAVKNSLAKTYATTSLKGDGQVIVVKFSSGVMFELLPAFKNENGSYTHPNSNFGGFWSNTNPKLEIQAIKDGDILYNNNLRRLCRMMRSWKHYNSVPIKGILLDTLCQRFISSWNHRDKSFLYYDYMTRDFLKYLDNLDRNQSTWKALGSWQTIYNENKFSYKASQSYKVALSAIEYHSKEQHYSAKREWSKIYGARFPS